MHSLRALVASLLLLATCLGSASGASSADQLHLSHGTDADGNPQITLGIDPAEGFTMVIATYQRDLLLPPLIKHLTSTPPPSLRQILIVWQNVDRPVPDFLSPSALDEYSTSGVAVSVRKSWKNSMNERFRPILDWGQEIATNSIMIMDDDVVLRKEALEWGYEQFVEQKRSRIVGFSPREFERAGSGEWKYITKPTSTYSMILSNAAFFSKDWLVKYWDNSDEMASLRNYVDGVFNCDDILVNFVVSNLTRTPPLLLQPSTPLRTIPTEGGLWNRVASASASPGGAAPPDTITTSPPRPEHFSTRKECLAHYFSHFARHAPPSSPRSRAPEHFPLIKTRTSISQDVEDHSRWMFDNEMWETVVWARPDEVDERAHGDDDDDDDELSAEEEAMLESGDFESFLQGLTDDEVDELMQSLEDEIEPKEESRVEDGIAEAMTKQTRHEEL